jgi:hypothetical protein
MLRTPLLVVVALLAVILPFAAGAQTVETALRSRNTVMLELDGQAVSLAVSLRSHRTGRELEGEITFRMEAEDGSVPDTDATTCAPSLTLGCGVVARFIGRRSRGAPPLVLEARVEDGVFRVRDPQGLGGFVEGLIANDTLAVKLRVDQADEFLLDIRQVPWPLAPFDADHPFAGRFAEDPVVTALRARFPQRYLRIVTLARRELPETGPLSLEDETKILEAMHAEVARLRPMVPDALLERIVANALAAAKAVGDKDPGLCNALAVAARSAVTAPDLRGGTIAQEEYALWQETVQQASPRNLRKVPSEALLPSTPRFEHNLRVANERGCGMFEAVIEAMLALPPEERRLWLRATVGTMDDPRGPASQRQ